MNMSSCMKYIGYHSNFIKIRIEGLRKFDEDIGTQSKVRNRMITKKELFQLPMF